MEMIFLFKLCDQLIGTCDEGCLQDSKKIAELSIGLYYAQKFFTAENYSLSQAHNLQDKIFAYIHNPAYINLLSNYFLLQQHITPYVFIRDDKLQSPYFEGLLKTFQNHDLTTQENFPYRTLERNHLLYILGIRPITISLNSPVVCDALQIQSFNHTLSYALTHTIFYSTDFSSILTPNQTIKDYCKILMAQCFYANDIDLFLEVCICFLSQNISKTELKDMLALIHDLQLKNYSLFHCSDVSKDYHPLIVHDILRGLVLKRFRFDIMNAPASDQENGPIRSLWPITEALGGKDSTKISTTYAAYAKTWGPLATLEKIIKHKFILLNELAKNKVLFEREFSHLGRRDNIIYSEYQKHLIISQELLNLNSETGDGGFK